MPDQDNVTHITKDDIIKKYTVTSLMFNQKTSAFSYDFPITKVFNTPEETIKEIEENLRFEPNVWHTVCPLYMPKELENETDVSNCLRFDSLMKESILRTKPESEEKGGAKVIPIEDVYRENGKSFPGDNMSPEIS